MNYWLTYVKYSYEVILEAEAKLSINLEHEMEAYMVHLFARYLDKPNINTEPVSLRIMQSVSLPKHQKKTILLPVAEECLLINGLELAKNKWPTNNYYAEMGQMAYDNLAYADNPVDIFYTNLANNFKLLSSILNKCKVPQ